MVFRINNNHVDYILLLLLLLIIRFPVEFFDTKK